MQPENCGIDAAPAEVPAEEVNTLHEAPAEESNIAPAETAAEPAADETAIHEAHLEEKIFIDPSPAEQPASCQPPVQPEKPKKARKQKKRPHILLRAVFQFFSFVLCLVLFVSLLATAVVVDLRQAISAGGIQQIVDAIFSGLNTQNTPAAQTAPLPDAVPGMETLRAVQLSDEDWIPDDGFSSDDIPEDILTGGNGEANMDALYDWVFDMIEENVDGEVNFTKEDFQAFLEESTISGYVSEKLAGFAEDFINGTENTSITTEEIMQLLDENAPILESRLNIVLTEENKNTLQKEFDRIVVTENLNATIRDTVNTAVEEAMQESLGIGVEVVKQILQMLLSDMLLYILLGICLVLILLLCLLNYYNVGAGFTWSAAAGLLAGAMLAVPLLAVRFAGAEVALLVPDAAGAIGIVQSFSGAFEPVHYGLLLGSAVVFVLSMVWRIIAFCLRRKHRDQP